MKARLAVPVVLAVILTACSAAPTPSPVSVDANQQDLNAEQGAVSGTVLMFPKGRSSAMEPADRQASPSTSAPRGGQPLSIRFIVVEDGVVSGTLEPYKDPDCDCLLSTTFTGRVHGDVIQGSFVSHGGPGRVAQDGRWKVTRKSGS